MYLCPAFVACSGSKKRKVDNVLGDMMASTDANAIEDNSPADTSDRDPKEDDAQSSNVNKKGFMRLPGDAC